nr:immunoglobulin heavy chain junction region [Macaca mulatta]MOW19997.1 immunoglobulin heavy chain junction region [Macaca mulatta]MOW20865.1 immunoglobulin heavy chain junction region [Macaca mulatta]MOW20972.1 immunoglobulin heavy chain junction region [Macaca mulatta]MOW22461.1 immunoglobulin heavy chain junction region [Macaca mulatta]
CAMGPLTNFDYW